MRSRPNSPERLAALEAQLRRLSVESTSTLAQHETALALGLLETARVTVVVLDLEHRVVFVNRHFETLSAWSLDELRGRDWFSVFVPNEQQELVGHRFDGAIHGSATRGFINPLRMRDGSLRTFEWYDRLLRDESGAVMALLAIGHDVTERVVATSALERANAELEARVHERSRELAETNRALAESQRRLSAIVEHSEEGMVLLDASLEVQYANPAAERVLGQSAHAMLGRRLEALWSPECAAVRAAVDQARRQSASVAWESPAPVEGRWLSGTAGPAEEGVVVVFRDETETRRASEALRAREALLREAEQIAQIGSWELNLRTNVLEWSDEIYELIERERGSLDPTYERFLELVHPDDRDQVDREYRRSVEERTAYDYVHRLVVADGRCKYVRERGRTDYDEHGVPLRSIGTAQDVTREVLAERAMAVKDAALESSLNAFAIAGLDGRLTYVNRAFVVLWGLESAESALGRSVDTFWAEPSRALEVAGRILSEGAWSGRLEAIRENGERRTLELAGHLVRDRNDAPTCMMASFVDVTARVAAEHEAKRAAEALTIFKQLADSANQPIGMGSIGGAAVYLNDALRTLLEIPPEVPTSDVDLRAYYAPETLAFVERVIEPEIRTGRAWSGEIELRTHSGRSRRTIHHSFLVRDLRGEPVGLANAITDITDRVEAERRLAASEASFRTIFKQVAVGIVLTDLEHRILRANKRFCEIAGRSRSRLLGVPILELLTPEDARAQAAALDRLITGEDESHTAELRFPTVVGSERWIELAVSARVDEGRATELLWVVQDITARRSAERELRHSRDALLRTESLAKVASWEWSPSTGEFRGSPELYRQFDLPPGSPLSAEIASERIHPDDRARTRAYSQSVLETGHAPPIEYRVVDTRGEVRVLRAEMSSSGPELLYGFSQDVTEKKTADARIAAQLREKEVLLREIHHRVKNNLQVISSLLYFQEVRTEEPTVAQLFRESRDRVRAMASVHETLYESADLGRVEFHRYAETLTRALVSTYGRPETRVEVRIQAGATTLDVDDAVPCGLITSELVTNALKYAFPGRAEGSIRVALESTPDDMLRLSVRDDGVGLSVTLEESDSLGLRLVRALAEQLQGRLEIDSSVRGTEVSVTFRGGQSVSASDPRA